MVNNESHCFQIISLNLGLFQFGVGQMRAPEHEETTETVSLHLKTLAANPAINPAGNPPSTHPSTTAETETMSGISQSGRRGASPNPVTVSGQSQLCACPQERLDQSWFRTVQ